ncbi:Oidioi.mRNA.OKI2018_I69.XSR.g16328.t1.cds [Oikopleura dioica]|uniref:Oidioi.mRNA.OKI2018_I69.XSR.g16328.t1.cds n=1 Tax=Oikopleura dioica TaxID=34765 RepID=A0ABN7SJS2_OIKDI|nr:Oidioi.mRNA.OKI2018_I69.XSR.g16328.t1.cds [Oikopleura dioica]
MRARLKAIPPVDINGCIGCFCSLLEPTAKGFDLPELLKTMPNEYRGTNSQGNQYTVTDRGYYYNNSNGSHYANEGNHEHYVSDNRTWHYNSNTDSYSSGRHYANTNRR